MDDLENFKKELEENPFQGDMLTSTSCRVALRIGLPHLGQENAESDTILPQSGHLINPITDFLFSFCRVNKKTNSMKNIMHFFEL